MRKNFGAKPYLYPMPVLVIGYEERLSGRSSTIDTIKELLPEANVIEGGLSISRDSVPDAKSDVQEWVSGLRL